MEKWTVHLEGGPRRVNHAAVVLAERIYSFGGYCTGEDYATTRPMDVHVLNTVTYRWFKLPVPKRDDNQYCCVPYQRYGHTAVAYQDCAYIWGGRNDVDGACKTLFRFDANTQTWSIEETNGETPEARDGHSACVIDNKMYIFGGYEAQPEQFSNQIHVLDFPTMTWSLVDAKGKAARWRDFHSATGLGDNMYIFGGRSDKAGPYHTGHEIYCNVIQVFNTTTNRWNEPVCTGDLPHGRRSHSAFEHEGALYVFGGYNGLFDQHFDDLFKFDPERLHWSVVRVQGKGPQPRRRQCCCVIYGRVFLFGGTSPSRKDNASNNEIELVDQSDLHVLDFNPSLKTTCMLSIHQHNIPYRDVGLPKSLSEEIRDMVQNNCITRPLNSSG